MSDWQLETPVSLVIFNRPQLTERVFEVIRQVKPPKLYLTADGPRPDHPDDVEKCAAARAVVENIDWDCQVLRNYSDTNVGCGRTLAGAISWVLEHEEEAIFLEDDTVPDPTFFRFCQEMLERYRDDERVMMITGTNPLGEWKSDIQSYHLSKYGPGWGYGIWRRSWRYFDYEMKLWGQQNIRELVRGVIEDEQEYRIREKLFWRTYRGENVTWMGYQWTFGMLIQSGLTIVPAVNLISCTGFGENATHTRSTSKAAIHSHPFPLPIKLNPFTVADREFDREYMKLKRGKSRNRWYYKSRQLLKLVWHHYLSYMVKIIQRSQLYRWHISRWRHVPPLVQELGPKTILEIGVGKGKGAERLLRAGKRTNDSIRYYGFDFFEDAPVHNNIADLSFLHRISSELIPSPEGRVRQRLERTGAEIHLYRGDVSVTLPQSVNGLPLMDLVIIDCGPSHELLSTVYNHVKPLLRPGSMIIFEGYRCQGVTRLVHKIDSCQVKIIHQPLDRMDLAVLYFQDDSNDSTC